MTLKVGDKVRVIESNHTGTARVGDVHTVVVGGSTCVLLDGVPGHIHASRVEKIEPVPFKLERGDKVVNRKTGREGFVTGGQVFDIWNTCARPVPASAIEEYEEHRPGTYDLIKKDAPW